MIQNLHLFDYITDGVYFVDMNRQILYFNKEAERITGFSFSEVKDSSCANNILNHVNEYGLNLCTSVCPLHRTLIKNEINQEIVYLHHKQGHRVKVSIKTIPYIENGEVIGALEIFTDLSNNNLIDNLLAYKKKALIDPLTQMGNRHYFEEINDTLFNETYNGAQIGILFIDIDNFKAINDTHGHDVGDRVLRALSKTLINNISSGDYIFRYGGEEFLIILKDANPEYLMYMSDKLRVLAQKSSVRHMNEVISYTISIGSTLVKKGEVLKAALIRADDALYLSKNTGKNKITLL